MEITRHLVPSIKDEFAGAELGDKRRARRLLFIADTLGCNPALSFPRAFADASELEAVYRFLSNDQIEAEAILAPHIRRTGERAAAAGRVVVAHDTTEFNFGLHPRTGLGAVGRGKSHGFYLHCSLVIEQGEEHAPVGVIATETYRRSGRKNRRKKASHRKHQTDPTNEGLRWSRSVNKATQALPEGVRAIHVMDRESDQYPLLAEMCQRKIPFVVRNSYDRCVCDARGKKLRKVLAGAPVLSQRRVDLGARPLSPMPSYRKTYPPRPARSAVLAVSATSVTLQRPDSSNRCPIQTLDINVVRVFESDPPAGQSPVEWYLFTNEPIGTPEEIWAIVDAYRARWVIEELFKALKTGCTYEERQLESFDSLHRALAVFIPIAWTLLALRTLSRTDPERPATDVLSPFRIECLRAVLAERTRKTLPEQPTAVDALMAIAKLGGHLRRNGPPGWLVLWRGMHVLLLAEVGYRAAHKHRRARMTADREV